MSLLVVLIAGTATALMVYLSVTNLQQKRVQMYKEKYKQALQMGNEAQIIKAGKE